MGALHDRSPFLASLCLGVMAKYWEPGKVKTRLGAAIGMAAAAKLHRCFCTHLSRTLCEAADQREYVVAPPQRQRDFEAALAPGWQIQIQSGGDLGNRMASWFGGNDVGATTDQGSADQVSADRVLIGADCPTLGPEVVDRAARLLHHHDLVLGPSRDGGYYLIALRGPWRDQYARLMSDMPWSSDQVFQTTVQRAKQAGLTVATLDWEEDIDTVAELDRLRENLCDHGQAHVALREAIDAVMNGESP